MKSLDATQIPENETSLSPPLAPPYSSDAGTFREQLAAARPVYTPKYVYHLYTLHQENGNAPAVPQLIRSYASNELAAHDALCWLADIHRKRGATFFAFYEDEEYKKSTFGRCRKFYTGAQRCIKLGASFSVWLTEDLLY